MRQEGRGNPALTKEFQSTHPVRGATQILASTEHNCVISIHAPRAGCDMRNVRVKGGAAKFQSTHPVRGATGLRTLMVSPCAAFQSTHPVRGATFSVGSVCRVMSISIHAPRAGCDSAAGAAASDRRHFNPRTPCGVRLGLYVTVSRSGSYFNPRTPCGVRHEVIFNKPRNKDTFQSTHPVRGATQRDLYYQTKQQISIHAPRAGCDHDPRSDRRRPDGISIHAPRAGCDL